MIDQATFMKWFDIERTIKNKNVSSSKLFNCLANAITDDELRQLLSFGVRKCFDLFPKTNPFIHNIQQSFNTLLSSKEVKNQLTINTSNENTNNNTTNKEKIHLDFKTTPMVVSRSDEVFGIENLHFKIFQYLPLQTLMICSRVSINWLYISYDPRSTYYFSIGKCFHLTNKNHDNNCTTSSWGSSNTINVKYRNETMDESDKSSDYTNDKVIIKNILRFRNSNNVRLFKWNQNDIILNNLFNNLRYFNKISKLTIVNYSILTIKISPMNDITSFNTNYDNIIAEAIKENEKEKEKELLNGNKYEEIIDIILKNNCNNIESIEIDSSILNDFIFWKHLNNVRVFAKLGEFIAHTGSNKRNHYTSFNQQKKSKIFGKIINNLGEKLISLEKLVLNGHGSFGLYCKSNIISTISLQQCNNININNKLKYLSFSIDKNEFNDDTLKYEFDTTLDNVEIIIGPSDYQSLTDKEIFNISKMLFSKHKNIITKKLTIEPESFGINPSTICGSTSKLLKCINEFSNSNNNNSNNINKLNRLSILEIGLLTNEDNILNIILLLKELNILHLKNKLLKSKILCIKHKTRLQQQPNNLPKYDQLLQVLQLLNKLNEQDIEIIFECIVGGFTFGKPMFPSDTNLDLYFKQKMENIICKLGFVKSNVESNNNQDNNSGTRYEKIKMISPIGLEKIELINEYNGQSMTLIIRTSKRAIKEFDTF